MTQTLSSDKILWLLIVLSLGISRENAPYISSGSNMQKKLRNQTVNILSKTQNTIFEHQYNVNET